MARIALFLFLLFAALLVLRALRIFLERWARSAGAAGRPQVDGELVRDPICGAWIDRRLAIAGRRGEEWHPVCSESCRKTLEARP
jgi:hypothetical protein